jgi:hypothetical protein
LVKTSTIAFPAGFAQKIARASSPWLLFAGAAYLDANGTPQTPADLRGHPSLFMMRVGMAPVLAPAPFKERNGPDGHPADAEALERRYDRAEASGGRRPGGRPPGLPAIPLSLRSFLIGAVFCLPFASSSIT